VKVTQDGTALFSSDTEGIHDYWNDAFEVPSIEINV
jgi:hypothetical protein